MGIPGFFMYIKTKYPISVELVNTLSVTPQCDNLLIDTNPLMHDIVHARALMPSELSYEVFASRLMYELDKIISFLNPQKLVYIAVDGTSPLARLSPQLRRVESEDDTSDEEDPELFGTINLTPGTEVMERISDILQYYIALRMSTDPAWKKLAVIYSSHRCPGEGEHKIIEYLRDSIANGTFDFHDHTLCYGSDADLILLAMTLHQTNVSIIRKDDHYDSSWEAYRQLDNYYIIDIPVLVEILKCEITKGVGSWMNSQNKDRVIDDFVFFMSFCGNDFMPHIPFIYISKNAIRYLMIAYIHVLKKYHRFILTDEVPDMEMTKAMLQEISKKEKKAYHADYLDYRDHLIVAANGLCCLASEEKKEQAKALIQRAYSINESTDFCQYRELYYQIRFGVIPSEKALESIAGDYFKGLVWVMNYYYGKNASWSWAYPYHFSPFASDIVMYLKSYSEFEGGIALTPFQQMLYEPSGAIILPPSYRTLMTDPNSPLARFYPQESSFDLSWRTKEYGAIVLLPVLSQRTVINAISEWHCNDSLTEEEKKRDTPEPEFFFSYSDTVSDWPTPLDPSFFPVIEQCHCERTIMNPNDVHNWILRSAHENTCSPLFPTLYPQYNGIHYSRSMFVKKSDQNPTKREFQLYKPLNSIIRIRLNYDRYQTLEGIFSGLGKYVYYDYPRYRVGEVIEIYFCDYGCKEDEINGIHIYRLSEGQRAHFKNMMEVIKKNAYFGGIDTYHDVGFLDISSNAIMVRIRPIHHICRNLETHKLYPFFSYQYIDYPLCLIRPVRSPNILNTIYSFSGLSDYSLEVGDSVVYIGSEESDGVQLRGSVGKVTVIGHNSLYVELTVSKNGYLAISDDKKWYSRDELKTQIPEKYQLLLPGYLQWYICPKKDRKIALLLKSCRFLVGLGFVRYDSDTLEKDPARLPSFIYSYLSFREEKQKSERLLYSEVAVKLAQEFFEQFGDEMLRLGLYLQKPSFQCWGKEQLIIEKKEKEEEEQDERQQETTEVSIKANNDEEKEDEKKETILVDDSAYKELSDRIKRWMEEKLPFLWVPANMRIAGGDYRVQLKQRKIETVKKCLVCSKNDVLVRETQYNIVSDIIIRQPLPSLGQRVVVIQHPSIPFGSQGTVVGVNPDTLWLEVILDSPSYAGVSFSYHAHKENCMGHCVAVHKYCCYLIE